MKFELSDDQRAIQKWAKNFAQAVVAPAVSKLSDSDKLPMDLLKKLSTEGFMSLMVPEAKGGAGLDSLSFSLVITELAKICASTSISVAVSNMIADVLVREGQEHHHDKFLSQLLSGESPTASFCLTENSSGSDASALQMTAKKEGDHYCLNGEKIYVTNGAFSNFFLVMARTTTEVKGSKGVSAFLVPRASKGVVIGKEEDKMGLSASSTIRMVFENVMVPESDRLLNDGEGMQVALRALDGGRISVASQALGVARRSLEAGIEYAKLREQFGKSLSEFQAIQWKIANAATELSAAELLIRRAAWLKSQQRPHRLEASMAKLFSTEMAIRLCNEMIQIHGGYGYIKDYPVEKYYRDVRVTSLYEGTSEIQRTVIAKNILGGL